MSLKPDTETESPNQKTIAIVSGKGGSGKTMIAAMLARILDLSHKEVILVDCDTATGGLTYYLGLKYLTNTSVGLADLLTSDNASSASGGLEVFDSIQDLKGWRSGKLVGIGDHRRLYKNVSESELPARLANVIGHLSPFAWVVADCRGGIDQESLAVCKAADSIVLVLETDTASFQASQYLVDVLSSAGLADKLGGFIINKVFDDPSVIARNGTAIFRCRYLGAIPFDFAATRAFLVGDLPSDKSVFGTHVWGAAYNLAPNAIESPHRRIWNFEEFRGVGISDIDSQRGGTVAAALILVLFLFWLMLFSFHRSRIFFLDDAIVNQILVAYLAIVGLFGSLEQGRRVIGRMISFYVRLVGSTR